MNRLFGEWDGYESRWRHQIRVGVCMAVCVGGLALTADWATAQTTDGDDSSEPAAAEKIDVVHRYRDEAIRRWDDDIAKLEAVAASQPVDADAILVVGSSSIRRWGDERMAEALKPYQTRRRGYGGAKYTDLAVFAERLIGTQTYRGLVVFVGNDVKGVETDTPIDDVAACVRHIIDVSKRTCPTAPVLFIEVTPTPERFAARDALIELNHRLRQIALTTPGVHFLSTWEHYLGDDRRPKPELFGDDNLHQSQRGYDLWSRLIKNRLDEIFAGSDND